MALPSKSRHLLHIPCGIAIACLVQLLVVSGCATNRPNGLKPSCSSCASLTTANQNPSVEDRLAFIAAKTPYKKPTVETGRAEESVVANDGTQRSQSTRTSATTLADHNNNQQAARTNASFFTSELRDSGLDEGGSSTSIDNLVVRGQSPDQLNSNRVVQANQPDDGSQVRPATYQYPGSSAQGGVFDTASPRIGAPGEYNPTRFPANYTDLADLDVYVEETQTGRINFGGAYNSDNGLVGQFIIDERNFDIRRPPRSLQDIIDGTAWRGGGQAFRLELVPGSQLQRYLVSISDPYFLNTDWSASASAYYFDRVYFDWSERRLGGRLGLGRRIDQDISITTGLRMENVSLRNPRVNTSPELNAALGRSNLFVGSLGLVRDTRDNQFMASTGDFFSATVSQAFGDYTFTRGDLDYRRYRLLYERPDGSGRHTVSFGTRFGVSSSDTPIFENYFAGGFSSLRGFDFRGVGPMDGGVRIGGPFEWINSVEYMFPVTADDMIKAVLFCDFGTVEEKVQLSSDNFRVAPGFGFRVHLPAAGFGAPLAFDFGFPVMTGAGDEERIFSFYIGAMR